LNKRRKPHNILMRVCLLLFELLSLTFLTIDARMGRVMIRGFLQKKTGLACRPTILPLGLHAGYYSKGRRFDSHRGQAYFSSLSGVDIHSE
jgi:hypothetical protein